MPASEVMRLYREGKLHSGKGGKIVRKKSQARAIQISYACAEGKIKGKAAKKLCRKKVTKHH